jgi:putative ABC transport system permease protein
MTFLGLLAHNVLRRRLRAVVTALAVAIGVIAVMTLGVLTYSLRQTAVAILKTGKSDFTVSQRGVSDLLSSTLDREDIRAVRSTPGVESAIGTFVATGKVDADHPIFIEVGLHQADEKPYGITVLTGRSFADNATGDMMLGWRAAKDFGIGVGDRFKIEERTFRIVGIFSTGNVIGDASGMFPLADLQAWKRLPGVYTLAFVVTKPHVSINGVRRAIEHANPHLATARTQKDYGNVDQNLVLITAANIGGSILALFIGATGVMNTSLLSFFERIREFGLLRAVGWSRRRLFRLVIGEALLVSLFGAALGIGVSFGAVAGLQHLPQLRGVFHPAYDPMLFARALGFAFGMALLGALYPAARAASLPPLEALQHE